MSQSDSSSWQKKVSDSLNEAPEDHLRDKETLDGPMKNSGEYEPAPPPPKPYKRKFSPKLCELIYDGSFKEPNQRTNPEAYRQHHLDVSLCIKKGALPKGWK